MNMMGRVVLEKKKKMLAVLDIDWMCSQKRKVWGMTSTKTSIDINLNESTQKSSILMNSTIKLNKETSEEK
jgi:hypothetical protein